MKYIGMLLGSLLLMTFSPPTPAQTIETGATYAAYQTYERGAMIWREDSGTIYVLADSGKTLITVPEADYANLPDNADTNAPTGLVAPVSGFGRVWANVDGVRGLLGWATDDEIGYQAAFRAIGRSAGGLTQVRVNRADGRLVVLRQDGTWGPFGVPREINTLPAQATFSASWQAYEGGYMLWWSETGTIWVLADDGSAQAVNSQAYGALPPNTDDAPSGLIAPIMGFGRVWANYSEVRSALGWATAEEQAYQMSFTRTVMLSSVGGNAINFVVSVPGGRQVTIRDVGTWGFSD